MQARLYCLLIIFGLVLSACGGNAPNPGLDAYASTPQAGQPTQGQTQGLESGSISNGCTVQSPRPTPGPTEVSLFPPVTGADWVRGPEEAPVTILAYSDFECESCARLAAMLEEVQSEFPDQVRFVFRHLPLTGTEEKPFHEKAALAAQAAEAAGEQGKFWEMHDLLFERQGEWIQLEPAEFEEWLGEQAGELDLDGEQFRADLTAEVNVEEIQAAWERALSIGMLSAPFILVNGQIWPSDMPLSQSTLEGLVRLNLLEGRQFTTCPPMEIDPDGQYTATIQTEHGDIVIGLFADKAPIAVNNFVFLARQGWFDGVTFHRVLPGFMAQAGDPSGTGFGGPGYAFVNEDTGIKFDRPGLVAMANAGADTNGSQFFITYGPASHLDGGYTIFGEVLRGMEVVEKLAPRNPEQSPDLPPGDQILGVTITEK